MGTTKLTWLDKIKDGMLFREDFEAFDFVNNEGWAIVQGIPTQTNAVAVNGKYSLLLAGTQDEDGLPVLLQKDVSAIPPSLRQVFTVWYYDDMSTAFEGPFLKIKTLLGGYLQVGVRNGVGDDTVYYCNPTDVFTEDTFDPIVGATRTLGWHKFQIFNRGAGQSGTNFDIVVDDVISRNVNFGNPANASITDIFLQSAVAGNVTDSFGYFDELRFQRTSYVQILATTGRRIEIDLVAFDNVFGEVDYEATYLPEFNAYDLNISQIIKSDVELDNLEKLALFFQDIDLENGDVYVINEIDFTRKATSYQDTANTYGSNNDSVNKTDETITTARQESIQAMIRILEGDEWVANAQNFYQYARQGFPFSFMLDSEDTVFTTLANNSLVTADQIVVNPILSVPACLIQIGRYYAIEDAERTTRQIFKAIGISGTTITIDRPLAADFFTGSFVRSLNFWPFTELRPPRQYGFPQVNQKYRRYDWNLDMREYVP